MPAKKKRTGSKDLLGGECWRGTVASRYACACSSALKLANNNTGVCTGTYPWSPGRLFFLMGLYTCLRMKRLDKVVLIGGRMEKLMIPIDPDVKSALHVVSNICTSAGRSPI